MSSWMEKEDKELLERLRNDVVRALLMEPGKPPVHGFVYAHEGMILEPSHTQLLEMLAASKGAVVLQHEFSSGKYQRVLAVPLIQDGKAIVTIVAGAAVDHELRRSEQLNTALEEVRRTTVHYDRSIPSYEERAKRKERVPGHVRGGLNRYNFKRR